MSKNIFMIAAMGLNGAIGLDGALPWGRDLPKDMARFKEITIGHKGARPSVVVMGRKTRVSLGSQALPGRINVVMSRDPLIKCRNAIPFKDAHECGNAFAGFNSVWVIGGADIYKLFWRAITRLALTVVHSGFRGDRFFPSFDPSQWRVESHNFTKANRQLTGYHDEDKYDSSFFMCERIGVGTCGDKPMNGLDILKAWGCYSSAEGCPDERVDIAVDKEEETEQ